MENAEAKLVVDPKYKWIVDALMPKIKEFLKAQLVKLDKVVLDSPNKIDDAMWPMLKVAVAKWIDSL